LSSGRRLAETRRMKFTRARMGAFVSPTYWTGRVRESGIPSRFKQDRESRQAKIDETNLQIEIAKREIREKQKQLHEALQGRPTKRQRAEARGIFEGFAEAQREQEAAEELARQRRVQNERDERDLRQRLIEKTAGRTKRQHRL